VDGLLSWTVFYRGRLPVAYGCCREASAQKKKAAGATFFRVYFSQRDVKTLGAPAGDTRGNQTIRIKRAIEGWPRGTNNVRRVRRHHRNHHHRRRRVHHGYRRHHHHRHHDLRGDVLRSRPGDVRDVVARSALG